MVGTGPEIHQKVEQKVLVPSIESVKNVVVPYETGDKNVYVPCGKTLYRRHNKTMTFGHWIMQLGVWEVL